MLPLLYLIMTVPVPLIGGVIVIAVLIIFIIIYKFLQKRRSTKNSSNKGEYKKLEEGVEDELDEVETELEGENNAENGKSRKKKKGKRKTNSSSQGTETVGNATDLGGSTFKGVSNDLTQELVSRLQMSISYLPSSRELIVFVHQGENLGTGHPLTFEVRITLLPSKSQRFKTKPQASGNPVFDEMFTFGEIFSQDIKLGCLRARVYKVSGRKRNLVGEIRAELIADLELDKNNVEYLWKEITPASEIADDISDSMLVTDPETALMAPKETIPMLQVSLQYKTISGKLTVEIIKARHIKTVSTQKTPEIYVQVALLNSLGRELSIEKTSVCKGSFHPTFEETFYFPAIEFELSGLTVEISVYSKKLRKKELIGSFAIGKKSTGEKEQLHWSEMIEAGGEPVKGWYALSQR